MACEKWRKALKDLHGQDGVCRRFILLRHLDLTGISGTGIVAEGIQFSTGECALLWRDSPRSIGVHRSINAVLDIHGHNGATEIKWIDEIDVP